MTEDIAKAAVEPSSMSVEEYNAAVDALLSPTHQAMSKEDIAKSAARRTKTVQDMREYWSRIRWNEKNTAERDHSIREPPKSPRRLIHITGTKGKGSTACMCQAVLHQHGYSTGLFTSPHLVDIRERIRLNGLPVHRSIFANAYWKIRGDLEFWAEELDLATTTNENDDLPILPGYFRMLTLMAYYIFTVLDVDVWVIEVGMGGRYDATNFLDRAKRMEEYRSTCGVTLLDLDHTRILGNTVEQIAWEKGGIFAVDKANTSNLSPLPNGTNYHDAPETASDMSLSAESSVFVLDSNSNGVLSVLRQCAKQEGEGANLKTVDAKGTKLRQIFGSKSLGLAGQHQYGNAMLAVHLCYDILSESNRGGATTLDDFLCNSKTLTGLSVAQWPGRCQTVVKPPFVTFRLDGAHTPQSLTATVDWFLEKVSNNPNCILVFHCSHERSPLELLELLQRVRFSKVYFTKPDSSRPSPITVPSAFEILQSEEMLLPEKLRNVQSASNSTETWQDTLGILWRYLESSPRSSEECGGDSQETPFTSKITSNKMASQVVHELTEHVAETTEVLVTGSLYLVGSFLEAIEWREGSSPAM